jgi:hypothetical protein
MWRSYSPKRALLGQHQISWQRYRQACKEKRIDNYNKSLKILKDTQIPFIEHADKKITIATEQGEVVFHPTTGIFYGACEGRGIFDLIQKIL